LNVVERFARVGEIELCYETFGDEAAPAILLIMGLASQMVLWELEFCEMLTGTQVDPRSCAMPRTRLVAS
jgi:hypothetical protein